MWRPVVRVASRPMAPRLRALCTQKPAAPPAGSSGKEVAAEPTTTNRNKDGVATYNYGESLNLPEVTKEQAENAYLEATDVTRAMTPPISVAVEARDDMLKDRFNYVGVPRGLEPRTSRQRPRQVVFCCSHVCASPWTANNLNPANRAIYAGADGAVEPEVRPPPAPRHSPVAAPVCTVVTVVTRGRSPRPRARRPVPGARYPRIPVSAHMVPPLACVAAVDLGHELT